MRVARDARGLLHPPGAGNTATRLSEDVKAVALGAIEGFNADFPHAVAVTGHSGVDIDLGGLGRVHLPRGAVAISGPTLRLTSLADHTTVVVARLHDTPHRSSVHLPAPGAPEYLGDGLLGSILYHVPERCRVFTHTLSRGQVMTLDPTRFNRVVIPLEGYGVACLPRDNQDALSSMLATLETAPHEASRSIFEKAGDEVAALVAVLAKALGQFSAVPVPGHVDSEFVYAEPVQPGHAFTLAPGEGAYLLAPANQPSGLTVLVVET